MGKALVSCLNQLSLTGDQVQSWATTLVSVGVLFECPLSGKLFSNQRWSRTINLIEMSGNLESKIDFFFFTEF